LSQKAIAMTAAQRIPGAPTTPPATLSIPLPGGGVGERRVEALDGLRGAMTIAVVLSHYFGELPHGLSPFMFGWIAVDMFFVLSGYLIGTLILEKMDRSNFFAVFYVRRVCRTIPAYFFCVVVVFLIILHFSARAWIDVETWFPLWSYLSFTQNFFMVSTESIGPHWLAPTWTLALEEQFYLLAPALFVIVPRRWLPYVLAACAVSAVFVRALMLQTLAGQMGLLVLLPSRADVLLAGVLLAVLMRTLTIDWATHDRAIRLVPILALTTAGVLASLDRARGTEFFIVLAPFVTAVGSAAFICTLVRGAPEALRFRSKVLRFFGSISYSTYLTHLAVLGLMHGFLLGTPPDLATAPQLLVTLAALPVAVLMGWALTKIVEEPITAYGRSWKWGEARAKQPGSPRRMGGAQRYPSSPVEPSTYRSESRAEIT
jgi:peptidoglycan/LPS O-acetylase OafA/YrhL